MVSWIPFIERVDDESSDEPDSAEPEPAPAPEQRSSEPSEDVQENISSSFDAVGDQVTAMEAEIDTLEQRLESLEQTDEVMEAQIATLEEDKEELDSHMQEMLGLYDAIAAQVNPLVAEDLQSLIPELSIDAQEAADTFDLKSVPEGVPEQPMPSFDEEDMPIPDEPIEPPEPGEKSKHAVQEIEQTLQDEVIALQWLDKLVSEVGFNSAIQTIDYYTSIGWLSTRAKHQLIRRLRLCNIEVDEDVKMTDGIPNDVHRFSKEYLRRLNG